MGTWHPVTTVSELARRKKLGVKVDDAEVALFYIKDTVYALDDVCIHEGRQLSKGSLLFGKVICPGHQWKFDPATGEPDGQEGCQPTYRTKIDDDGTVYVEVPKRGESS